MVVKVILKCSNLVVGCGWAGIVASYFLLNSFPSLNVVYIDKENILGGLLRTEIIDGFAFDVGGSHIVFSRDQQVLEEMLSFLGNNVVEHRRKAYVYLDGVSPLPI